MNYSNPKDALLQLGITSPATLEDVKSAYRELLKIYHPDVHPDPAVAWQYYDITDAYNYLLECYGSLPNGAVLPEEPENGSLSSGKGGTVPVEASVRSTCVYASGARKDASSGPRVIGDAEGAKAAKNRTAWRKKSQKSEEKRRQDMLSALEERRKEALFQDTMDRIHAARAAELSAQIISAVLRGDKDADKPS